MEARGRVGSKGELFPPKAVKEAVGLEPRQKVIYRAEARRLIVEPVPTLEQVLKQPPAIRISLEAFARFRRELSRRAEA
jgi:bifunctional DNA-binding transcriptional regulator/antitoxin component of YhaV-PrlF toxin-antitoxin module